MADCTSSNDNKIFTKVVASVEVNYHVSIDLSNVVDVSQDRLAHHVITEHIEVNIFHEGFFWILVDGFQLLPYGVFFHFKVEVVIDAVAKHIAHDFNSGWHTIREAQSMVKRMLARCVGIELGAAVFYLYFKLASGAFCCTFKVKVL